MRRLEAVDRFAAVRRAAEDLLEATAVDPVLVDLELRELARPVRDVQLPDLLVRAPRDVADVRQHPLPALERPVRAVARLARLDVPRERRAVVAPARVPEQAPFAAPARVVDLELDLPLRAARVPRVDRSGDEDMPHATGLSIGDHRAALVVGSERDLARVAGHDLRRSGRRREPERQDRGEYSDECPHETHPREYRQVSSRSSRESVRPRSIEGSLLQDTAAAPRKGTDDRPATATEHLPVVWHGALSSAPPVGVAPLPRLQGRRRANLRGAAGCDGADAPARRGGLAAGGGLYGHGRGLTPDMARSAPSRRATARARSSPGSPRSGR